YTTLFRSAGPNHRSTVGMSLEGGGKELLHQEPARVVLVQSHLLKNPLLLGLEQVRLQARVHRDVREHLDGSGRAPRGYHRVIEGVVPRRPRIDPPADRFDLALAEI